MSDLVYVLRPRNTKEAREEVVRTEALQAERHVADRTARGALSLRAPVRMRGEGRRSEGVAPRWDSRLAGHGKGLRVPTSEATGPPQGSLRGRFPSHAGPPTRRSEGGQAGPPATPAVVSKTGRTFPRRSQGVHFKMDKPGNEEGNGRVRCFGCGREGHFRLNCLKKS